MIRVALRDTLIHVIRINLFWSSFLNLWFYTILFRVGYGEILMLLIFVLIIESLLYSSVFGVGTTVFKNPNIVPFRYETSDPTIFISALWWFVLISFVNKIVVRIC